MDTLLEQLPDTPIVDLSEIPLPDLDASDNGDLTIVLHGTVKTKESEFHFRSQRESREAVTKGLKRISANILGGLGPPQPKIVPKKGKQKHRKVKQTPSKLPTLRVAQRELDFQHLPMLGTLWLDLLQRDQVTISFPHDSTTPVDLQVVSCPPTVLSIDTFERMEQRILCGVPLVVSVQVLHAQRATVSWFVNAKLVQADSTTYTPTEEDIGHKIQILVTPIGSIVDGQEAYEFGNPVEAAPELPVVALRTPKWTTAPTPDTVLRIMTYNLLADQYGKQGIDHVPDDTTLHRSHRMPALMYELLAYHADIICLQEVDSYIYDSLYEPVLEACGYEGFFTGKLSGQQEGCATFWSTAKFDASDRMGSGINELLLDDTDDDGWTDHVAFLEEMPRIKDRVQKLGQILQCVTLTSRDGRRLVLGNTHLYYHPYGDHFRSLQAYGVCRKLDQLQKVKQNESDDDVPIVLCGDLNSAPTSGAIQLLQQRSLDATHPTAWENLKKHPTPKKKDPASYSIPTLRLPDSFPVLTSSFGAQQQQPKYTHCIPQFCDTLDYIFTSSMTTNVEAAPMPSKEQPMPNEGMPSDHISLVADYQLENKQ